MNLIKQINRNPAFSSPTSNGPEEQTRVLTDYIGQKNLFKIAGIHEPLRKSLTLKKFLKGKRNQQVVITSLDEINGCLETEGKVAAIGRDFVMLTNLQKRIWIPYTYIETANIPFGFPSYSNAHQHHLYDNQLQQRLTLRFGETVNKREVLVQQFFEESFRTNFLSWKGIRVEVISHEETISGKIVNTTKNDLELMRFGTVRKIPLEKIRFVSTLSLVPFLKKEMRTLILSLKEKVRGGWNNEK
ncbi:hypothetical protein CSV80_16430 [Sporosarcina sp. P12(2017)]|uniref:hypothetical protein n=1 Tax=unclassified Sporosarcina TaxID=2647733 RepID=UPI000C168233|nr:MULTISPECIES: hypothetical protein [unclassified Sporosarcina]PIC56030.1 hypothetical protein CSV81_16435 [Sporosarcina sp. P10]PIC59357.1 hypothetical protein CSV80_16430 [Sporosarcina sp. P12(2017)]